MLIKSQLNSRMDSLSKCGSAFNGYSGGKQFREPNSRVMRFENSSPSQHDRVASIVFREKYFMGYPRYMHDEELAAFGFAPTDDDSTVAKSRIYPNLTRRYRCPKCNLWASTVKGGPELVCEQCYRGGLPIETNGQFKKIYRCCESPGCERWRELRKMLDDAGVTFEDDRDGFGGYAELIFPMSWSEQDRIDMHWKINAYCVSKHGARKVECKKTGKLRSKVPGKNES